MVVPSLHARATVERQQREFTDGWDPLFIGYSAAVYFHTSETKINSWTTQAKKMRGSMPPKFEDVLRTLEEAGLENKLPIYDDGRIIVEEGHMALKDDMKFARRKYRAPYGLEELELRQDGKRLNAAGSLYVFLTEYKNADLTTPPPLSLGTPGSREKPPRRKQVQAGARKRASRISRGESMDETLSEAEEEMEVGNT